MKKQILVTLGLGLAWIAPSHADDFVNLDFNEPDLSHVAFDPFLESATAPVSEVVRGWTVSYQAGGAILPARISVDGGAPPLGIVTSVGEEEINRFGAYRLVFSAFAQGGPAGNVSGQRPLTLVSQRGMVPAGATSLDFLSSNASSEIEVRIDGVQQALGGLPNVGMQVDVRAFAGKEVLLEFAIPEKFSAILDVRGFTVVPEPSTWALFSVGAFALWWSSRRK